MSMWSFGLPLAQDLANFGATMYGNQVQHENALEANQIIDRFNAGQLPLWNEWSGRDPFAGGFDPSRFDPRNFQSSTDFGALQNNIMNSYWGGAQRANDLLGAAGQNAQDALFQGNQVGQQYLGEGNTAAQSRLDRAMLDPAAQAATAGGFVKDAGVEAYLANAMNEASRNSAARLQQGQQQTLANVLSRGGSLGEARDVMQGLQYNEGINKETAVRGAQAAAENMLNQNMQARANLQANAFGNANNLNAGFAGQGANLSAGWGQNAANLQSGMNTQSANAFLNTGQGQAGIQNQLGQNMAQGYMGLGQFQNESQRSDQINQLNAYQAMLEDEMKRYGAQSDIMKFFQNSNQTSTLAQAANIAGQQFVIPQFQSGTAIAGNLAQIQAAKEANKGKSSFSFLGIGGGCIAANSEVLTPFGPRLLAEVQPGDDILGGDHKYHRVVGKDCGTVPEEARHNLTLISTDQSMIKCTPDHVIGGQPAGQWKIRDRISVDGMLDEVAMVSEAPYEPTGDLMLEDNIPYIANGFVVYSTIGARGLKAWRDHVLALPHHSENGHVVGNDNPFNVWAVDDVGG